MRYKHAGMTLIELMVVVMIVGILAGIAIPSYRQYVIKGNRTEAKVELMKASQAMEKCFTRFGVYNNDNCTAYTAIGVAGGKPTETGKYRLSFANVDDVSFTIRATPQDGQAKDTVCGNLDIDETGKRMSGAPDPKTCW